MADRNSTTTKAPARFSITATEYITVILTPSGKAFDATPLADHLPWHHRVAAVTDWLGATGGGPLADGGNLPLALLKDFGAALGMDEAARKCSQYVAAHYKAQRYGTA